MTELLKEFENYIDFIALMPSDGGRFEITINNRLIYSKLETGRHVNTGEIAGLVRKFMEENQA